MKTVALVGSLAASAYAHGRIISIDVDGTEYEGYTSSMVGSPSEGIAWSADNQDNGFVGPDSYSSSDIACHKVCTQSQLLDITIANNNNRAVLLVPRSPLSLLVAPSSSSGTPGPSLTTVPSSTTSPSALVTTAPLSPLATSPSSRSTRLVSTTLLPRTGPPTT